MTAFKVRVNSEHMQHYRIFKL